MSKEYSWDGRVQRYRDKQTGRFLRNQTVMFLVEQQIKAKEASLENLFLQLLVGKKTLPQFQSEALDIIKYLHTQQYLLGKGGFKNTTAADYLKIARDLKDLHYPAFRQFVQDLKDGKLTESQANYRLDNFAVASRSSYNYGVKQSAIENGYAYARRFLSVAEHCAECPMYAAMGVVPITNLIMPGEKCGCMFNCKCYVIYYKELPTS